MKKYKVVLVEQESCASCYQLQFALKPLCDKKNIEFQVLTNDQVDNNFLTKYNIEALPSGLLFYGDELIGKFKGYQPDEILDIWLDTKIKEKRK